MTTKLYLIRPSPLTDPDEISRASADAMQKMHQKIPEPDYSYDSRVSDEENQMRVNFKAEEEIIPLSTQKDLKQLEKQFREAGVKAVYLHEGIIKLKLIERKTTREWDCYSCRCLINRGEKNYVIATNTSRHYCQSCKKNIGIAKPLMLAVFADEEKIKEVLR